MSGRTKPKYIMNMSNGELWFTKDGWWTNKMLAEKGEPPLSIRSRITNEYSLDQTVGSLYTDLKAHTVLAHRGGLDELGVHVTEFIVTALGGGGGHTVLVDTALYDYLKIRYKTLLLPKYTEWKLCKNAIFLFSFGNMVGAIALRTGQLAKVTYQTEAFPSLDEILGVDV